MKKSLLQKSLMAVAGLAMLGGLGTSGGSFSGVMLHQCFVIGARARSFDLLLERRRRGCRQTSTATQRDAGQQQHRSNASMELKIRLHDVS